MADTPIITPPLTSITAARIWNAKGTKATVVATVFHEGEMFTLEAGGERAARAQAVVATRWSPTTSWRLECSADAERAFQVADKRRRGHTMRHAGHLFTIDPVPSVAGLVQDGREVSA